MIKIKFNRNIKVTTLKTRVSILFNAKRAKANTCRIGPIYTRIKVNGKRIELSSNKFVEPSTLSTDIGKMKDTSEEDRFVSSHLDVLKIQIIEVQIKLNFKKIPLIA